MSSKPNHDPRALEESGFGQVSCGPEHLTVKSATGDLSELKWNEIDEVHAYTADLLTTDLICLASRKSGSDEYCEIHEEMAGYHDILELLPRYLPEFTLEWYSDVAFPAFETNHKIIWERSPNPTSPTTLTVPLN